MDINIEIQNQEKKTCKSCKFYEQHYVKYKTRFREVYCGVCKFKYSKKSRPDFFCEHWEELIIKEQEKHESLKKALCDILKKLNDIADVIYDDIYKDNISETITLSNRRP